MASFSEMQVGTTTFGLNPVRHPLEIVGNLPRHSSVTETRISKAFCKAVAVVFGLAPTTRITKFPPTTVLVNITSFALLIDSYTARVSLLASSLSPISDRTLMTVRAKAGGTTISKRSGLEAISLAKASPSLI